MADGLVLSLSVFVWCFCVFALLGLAVADRILPISRCSFRIHSFPNITFWDSLACLALGPHRPSVSPVLCGLRLTRKSELQSWLNLANSLITKERPYVSRSSLGAIWTPQDWHEMVSACAWPSCMTSHGVGICLCHSFSVLKSPSN